MAKLFISHSSRDRDVARQIAEDLAAYGHSPWLDEWEIRVGECIPTKVEQGLAGADYVVVILSAYSTVSDWVSIEWKAKYWEEIERKKVMVLPVLLTDCEIPMLLKTKRYADFRQNYTRGFVDLMSAISPTIRPYAKQFHIPPASQIDGDIEALLSRIQSREASLCQCMTEAMGLARRTTDTQLERFCRNELEGWNKDKLAAPSVEKPIWRQISGYISFGKAINLQYFGWGDDASSIFDFMRANPDDFRPFRIVLPEPLSKIVEEAHKPHDTNKSVLSVTIPSRQLLGDKVPDALLLFYARSDAWSDVVESVRGELTKRLIAKLSPIQ